MSWCYGSLTILVAMALQLLMIRCVSSQNITNEYINHKCNSTEGKYTQGSPFERKLNALIRHISTLSLKDGYFNSNISHGFNQDKDDPNNAVVLLQCRGDSYGSKCLSCFKVALAGLRERCPRNKGAIIWYDQCLLSTSYIISDWRIHYENNFWINNGKNATVNPKLFEKKTKALMKKLVAEASKLSSDQNKDKGALYAAGDTMVGTKKLYAMVQCTRDLHENGCAVCLEFMIQNYEDCCAIGFGEKDCCNKAGVRALGRSCNFRYEFYPFLRTSHRLL